MNDNEQIKKACADFGAALAEHLIAQEIGAKWPTISATLLAMRASHMLDELRFAVSLDNNRGSSHYALAMGAFAMMIWDNLARQKNE